MGLFRRDCTSHPLCSEHGVIMDPTPDKTQKLIEEMTSVLKGDEELRLDVHRELSAHFEDTKAAFLEEGKSEEESDELALKAFGEPTRIADHLADSNLNRMKFRASMKICLSRILVPLSLLMAIWMGVHYAQRMKVLAIAGISEGLFCMEDGDSYIPEEAEFLFLGDQTRLTKSAQQRAIWEKAPENKVYFANYFRELLHEYQDEENEISFSQLKKELRLGEKLDPDNAYYNYVLAAVLFAEGYDLPLRLGVEISDSDWIIHDEEMLASAVEELKKAEGKPGYRRYIVAVMTERIGLLPETRRMEDSIAKMGHMAAIVIPELQYMRKLFQAVPHYVKTNPPGLTHEDAGTLLNAWQVFTRKANRDTCSLIDVLVMHAIISKSGEKTAEVYKSMGNLKAARQTSLLANKLSESKERWNAAKKSETTKKNEVQIKQRAGILATVMLPAIGAVIDENTLRPGRMLDFVLAEQFTLSLVLWSLVVFMIGAWMLTLVCRRVRGGGPAPLLLLPPLKVIMKILGLGMLLPVILYAVYTRWTGWSSHEYSIVYMMPRNGLEFLLLMVTYLALTTSMAAAFIQKRCKTLDLPMPNVLGKPWRAAFWIGLAGAWIICLTLTGPMVEMIGAWGLVMLGVAFNLIFFLTYLVIFITGCITRRAHGLYYGTLARSLMPVYACAVLFIGGICLPWLQYQETALLQQDQLFGPEIKDGFSSVEEELTHRLKEELEASFEATQL